MISERASRITRRRIGTGIVLGLMTGLALGQNVTIPWPTVSYKGAVEMLGNVTGSQCVNLYTVPAGLKLRVTSFLIDSLGSPVPLTRQFICSGDALGNCLSSRTNYLTSPAGSTLSVPLTSGILFNPGETVQACSDTATGRSASWTLYGFLYR